MHDAQQEPIAIIGMGCRFPKANNLQMFWNLLRDGEDAIREVPATRWDIEKLYDPDSTMPGKMMSRWGGFLDQFDQFDWQTFRMLPREAKYIDPQQRLLLEVAWEALEDAGLPLEEIAGSKTSVFVGIGWSDYLRMQSRNWSQLDEYTMMGSASSFASNRLSYAFDLKGPSISLDTGCTSSLTAIYLACQSIWTGEASLALAGGANLLLSPDSTIMLSKSRLLSPQGQCKTLDAHADGFVRGEGAGMVILKPLSQVRPSDRVYALIRGIALSHNGHNEWIIASSQSAQELLLRDAYHNAGINPSEVDYVELHGTGFLRGDAIETRALGNILGSPTERTHPCHIGSVKTNIGHLEMASGIASVIKVALSLYHREIPPTLHLQTLNPDIPLDDLHLAVPQTCTPWPEKTSDAIAGINTLAYTGSNAHAVLSSYSPATHVSMPAYNQGVAARYHLLTLSARTLQSLHKQVEAYRDFLLDEQTTDTWQDICYSANVRRSHHSHRFAVLGHTPQAAADALTTYLQTQNLAADKNKHKAKKQEKTLFLFSHSLSISYKTQYENLQREPAFRTTVEACDRIVQTLRGKPLLVSSTHTTSLVFDPTIENTIIHFVMQVSLATLLRSWGILPAAALGEGSGEVAAAYVAGTLSLEDALHIVSSPSEDMSILLQQLQSLPACIPLYSISVGLMNEDPGLIVSHSHGQLTYPQPSTEHIGPLLSHDDICLEIGYPSSLQDTLVALSQEEIQPVVLACLHPTQEAFLGLLEVVKTLYIRGYNINWSAIYHDEGYHCVSLPLYCWQRERLWPDWLDIAEISTPPEARHADIQSIKQVQLIEIAGRPIEQVLIDIWAEILELDEVSSDSSFFALGGHSLLAMQLLAHVRTTLQVEISLNDLLQAPTPSACAQIIGARYTSLTDTERVSSPLPTIEPDVASRYEPFPLTDVQQAYWVGRHMAFEIGGVGNHGYIEAEAIDLDFGRFKNALQHLIERHDMLKAIILADGQQQISEHVAPFPLKMVDLSGLSQYAQSIQLEHMRHSLDHQVFSVEQWPSFEIYITRLDEHQVRLHLSIESLFVDAWSMNTLIQEFVRFYHEPDLYLPPPTLSFRDYVLAEAAFRDSEHYQRAQNYWLERLATLPAAPDLPMAHENGIKGQPRFVHHEAKLNKELWQHLKAHAAQIGLTPSGVLLTAFAEILTAWSKTSHFSINMSTFNRLPFHPQVNDIVGDFTSLLVLVVDNTTPDTFANRAQRLQKQLWNDLDHSYYSGIQLLRELLKTQGNVIKAAMPIVFTSLLIQDIASAYPYPWGETLYCVSQTPQVWLDHQVLEADGELVFHWQSVDAIFPTGLIDAMFSAYSQLLQRLATRDECWYEPIRNTLPEQHRTLLAQVNTTEAPISHQLLHTLFIDQVAQRPDQLAIVSPTRLLTYKEVYNGALQLAHQLRQWGVRKNQLVGVVAEKGWEQVVAVLGILQSGAAYLPIDTSLPKERLLYLLAHGKVEVVLTQSWLNNTITWPDNLQRIYVDALDLDEDIPPALESIQNPDDLAYVIYTSGSTGLPKGVMIDHQGAVNTILDINQRFHISSTDRVLALSALNFDLSVYDIFGIMAAGGTIVLPTQQMLRDPASWLRMIQDEQVTIWNSVPALLQLLVEYTETHSQTLSNSDLRLALLSGDWIPLSLPDRLKKLCTGIDVISLGGATEASIWSILYPIETLDPTWKSIPYGRPMNNQSFFVLNDDLEQCPIWVSGYLYIAGIGLAQGYWRDDEKTQTSFFHHPRMGKRLYRTGDMGRYLPDGTIEFLGRQDFQVKVQGYRIELGEIETTLTHHPSVQDVVVAALGDSQSGKRLAAYVVPRPGYTLATDDLHQFLAARLPAYMVPTSFSLLDSLPLTANGKVDRKALTTLTLAPVKHTLQDFMPEKKQEPISTQTYAPQSSILAQVTQLIADVLKVQQIDASQSLLECGATSLDIFRIANSLESHFHIHLEFSLLFRLPSINAIAAQCAQLSPASATNGEDVTHQKNTSNSVPVVSHLILDPIEREQFKKMQYSLREVRDTSSGVQLVTPKLEDDAVQKYVERHSHPTVLSRPIQFKHFSDFLTCLLQVSLDGKPKHQWESIEGLYPVQTYFYIRPGGIEGVDAGIYYYHPVKHHLSLITPAGQLNSNIFEPTHQDAFNQAAFAVFLIGQLKAIEPIYGNSSRDFCLLEAGSIIQLLQTSASSQQMALSQIGSIDFEKIRHGFALEEECIYLHGLLGGAVNVESQEIQLSTIAAGYNWEEGTL